MCWAKQLFLAHRGNSSKYFETAYESSITGNWTQLYTDGVVKMGVGFVATVGG